MTEKFTQRLRCPDVPNDLTFQLEQRVMSLLPSVKTDYLKEQLLSKFVSRETDPPEVRRTRAINKWLATERENEATNDRLLTTPGDFKIINQVKYDRFMDWCRDLTRDIIGDTPPLDALIGLFSGGASTSRPRTSSQTSKKYLGEAHATATCAELFSTIVDEMPGWLAVDDPLVIKEVVGNVMFTVPKKTDIDRCACKEPDLNMFIQKGVGSFFRKALRKQGINLNDQSINRSLAREGSLTGKLSTLDLSSASDSVTRELVFQILPVTWFTLLDSVRCQVTVIDGEEHQNHMFSSMGNGFTFELESLLFYVLARAVAYFTGTRGVVSVYGDDIICSSDMSAQLIDVLEYVGFSTNIDKSHVSGPFRESCGGHYHNGVDITPFYVKEPISSLDQIIDVANKLRKWSEIEGLAVLNPEAEEIWLWLKSFVPSCLWGGGDTSFKYQLASNDAPESRLVEEMKTHDAGIGGYYHWLNTTWARNAPSEGVKTSSFSTSLNKLRIRRVRDLTVPRLPGLFLTEIFSVRDGSAPFGVKSA